MSTISIVRDAGADEQFRAVSGSHQSLGRTMGEALDALTAKIDVGSGALVFIQKQEPDHFFTAEQHRRMEELLLRGASLNEAERQELEELVDAEVNATVARTDALLQHLTP